MPTSCSGCGGSRRPGDSSRDGFVGYDLKHGLGDECCTARYEKEKEQECV